MGFFKKINDALNSKIKDKGMLNENSPKDNDRIEPTKKTLMSENRNFKYLDDLIHSGQKEIYLDYDIILDYDEESIYPTGIDIDIDDLIINGNGHEINAKGKTRIFNIIGNNVIINSIMFINGNSDNGSSIFNYVNMNLEVSNCKFIGNNSNNYGGSIINMGNLKLSDSEFKDNSSNRGASIYNEEKSQLKIHKTKFINNTSNEGAIYNKGSLTIYNCDFLENSSEETGGVITNLGTADIIESNFNDNTSKSTAGAIFNHNIIKIKNTYFLNNCSDVGGALINSGKLNMEDSFFIKNHAYLEGGCIHCQPTSNTIIVNTKFRENDAEKTGSVIVNLGNLLLTNSEFENNLSQINEMDTFSEFSGLVVNHQNAKFLNCDFLNHDINSYIVTNFNELEIFNSSFTNNNSKVIVGNVEKSNLNISNGKFNRNNVLNTTIYNDGECNIDDTEFNDNASDTEYCSDIDNKMLLNLQNIKVKNDNAKTIFNNGIVNMRKLSSENINKIENNGTLNNLTTHSELDSFNFSKLDKIIHEESTKEIYLKSDFILGLEELIFFEGGVDLEMDDLIIDGQNHIIDGLNKSRIFNILGKNITLKNIIFKNGSFNTKFDKGINGGGAIHILKDASVTLINCQFIHNTSNANGGAIYNNGMLSSENSLFDENESTYYGGAIYNNKKANTKNDEFNNNKSRIGGAIYNRETINIQNIQLTNNESIYSKPIFNNDNLSIGNCSQDLEKIIFNVNWINIENKNNQNFTYLKNQIQTNAKIQLKENIIFSSDEDLDIINGIEIIDDLEIEGNNHSIDAGGIARFFNISNPKSKVIFKNISFKNAFSDRFPLINNRASVIFENCKFINNKSMKNACLIENNNSLIIVNSIFSNNYCKNNKLINNKLLDKANNHSIILDIIETIFINNTVNNGEGLIFNSEELQITQSKFINNVLINSENMVSNKDKTIISNSEFCNNEMDGSILINYKNSSISNSKFINNVSKFGGGAISNQWRCTLNIKKSIFEKNSANLLGGAIINVGEVVIDTSEFYNNYSKSDGGSIMNRKGATIEIHESIFAENIARTGGSICNLGELTIINSKFKSNSSKEGGALNNNGGQIKIYSSTFDCNSADYDGAIANFGEMLINNSEFNNNSSKEDGGAIGNIYGILTLNNSDFNNNFSKRGGALFNFENSLVYITSCNFIDNSPEAISNLGLIYDLE